MGKLRNIQPTQVLILALILIVVGVLTFLLRDAVREFVVIPLAFLAWLGGILLRAIPQGILLALLLILCLYIILRGFAQQDESPRWPPIAPDTGAYHGRLSFWVAQLNNVEDSRHARENLALALRALILDILADQEHAEPDEILRQLRNGNGNGGRVLSVPPDIKTLLLNWQRWARHEPDRQPSQLIPRLRAKLRPSKQLAIELVPLDRKLQAAIEYVEAQLGVRNE